MNFDANRKNLLQLIILRSVAIIAQILAIKITIGYLSPDFAIKEMSATVFILFLFNIGSFFRYKKQKNISDLSLFLELIIDVLTLSLLIYFSGGISNPFISLFILQVMIAAILLKPFFASIIAIITLISYLTLSFFYRELDIFSHSHHDNFSFHLFGMMINHLIASVLLLIFITKINNNLAKQKEFARVGLLATSTAHNLSTPLNTIFIIIKEWQKNKAAIDEKNLMRDLTIIENQIERCKNSISEILKSCEKARLESIKSSEFKKISDEF
jgi:two-component system sensor histidine kinase RegB